MPRTPRASIRLEPEHLLPEALATLDERAREIVAKRYGANGYACHSRKNIGRALGLSAVRIGQIEMKAAEELLALRGSMAAPEIDIRCTNMARNCFLRVGNERTSAVYRLTVDVVVEIGDRPGGYWALKGVGVPTLTRRR